MLWLVLLGLFMICAGMSLVFSIYLCVLWLATIANTPPVPEDANKPATSRLSELEIEKMAGDEDGLSLGGAECAVCLDDIEAGQRAVVLPSCRHSFHVDCAQPWLSSHPHCPLCRASLLPPLSETKTTTNSASPQS